MAAYAAAKGGKIDEADLKPDENDDTVPSDAGMENGDVAAGESLSDRLDQPEAGSDDRGKMLPTSLPSKMFADVAAMAAPWMDDPIAAANEIPSEDAPKKKKKKQSRPDETEKPRKEKHAADEESKKEKKKKRKSKDAADAATSAQEESPKKKKKSSKIPERVDGYGSDY